MSDVYEALRRGKNSTALYPYHNLHHQCNGQMFSAYF